MDRFANLHTIEEVNQLLQERIDDDDVDVYDYICSARRKRQIHSKDGESVFS